LPGDRDQQVAGANLCDPAWQGLSMAELEGEVEKLRGEVAEGQDKLWGGYD